MWGTTPVILKLIKEDRITSAVALAEFDIEVQIRTFIIVFDACSWLSCKLFWFAFVVCIFVRFMTRYQ